MTSALRHIVDDVKDRLSRLRTRNVYTSASVSCGPEATGRQRYKKSRDGNSAALPPSGRPTSASIRRLNSSTGTGNEMTTKQNENGDQDGRMQTPDLIRPHVVAVKTASLPPLPPTVTPTAVPRRFVDGERHTLDSSTSPSGATYLTGVHVYEEIPTLPRKDNEDGVPVRLHHRPESSSSMTPAEINGHVYYISPIDGALCRLYPTAGTEDDSYGGVGSVIAGRNKRRRRHHQIVCPHVRPGGPSDRPLDVAALADFISGSVSTATANGFRGRELRMCSGCRRELREIFGETSRDLNTCDLSLLHVPCPYASDDDGIRADSGNNGGQTGPTRSGQKRPSAADLRDASASDAARPSPTASRHRRTPIGDARVLIHCPGGVSHVPGDVRDLTATPMRADRQAGRGDGKSTVHAVLSPVRARPALGVEGRRSAFSKFGVGRRNSLPVDGRSMCGGKTVPGVADSGLLSDSVQSVDHIGSRMSRASDGTDWVNASGRRYLDKRRRPILAGSEEVIINCLSAAPATVASTAAVATTRTDKVVARAEAEVGYLCLYDCRCRRCSERFSGASRNGASDVCRPFCDHRNGDVITDIARHQEDVFNNNCNRKLRRCSAREKHRGRHTATPEVAEFASCSINEPPPPGGNCHTTANSDVESQPQRYPYRRQMTVDGDQPCRIRQPVKSVYYNGLLASMIDLSECDAAASASRSSAADEDRLSCRATCGPRSWGLEMLQRSSAAAGNGQNGGDRAKPLQWHRRRKSWVRHRSSVAGQEDSRAASETGVVVGGPLHRSVGDLQLQTLQ